MNMVQITGISWYREADYETLKRLFVDGHKLPDSYDVWKLRAEKVFHDRLTQGQTVVKVHIDPEGFRSWCIARGKDLDARGRLDFVNAHAINVWKKTQRHEHGTA